MATIARRVIATNSALQILSNYAPDGSPRGECTKVDQDWDNEQTTLTFCDGSRLQVNGVDVVELSSFEGKDILRDVTIDSGLVDVAPHRLVTWDVNRQYSTGQRMIGYAFFAMGSTEPLFQGEDIGCSPMHAIDSDACLASVIGWLTLKPGDTDARFFARYTREQRAWADSYACETLAIIPYDADSRLDESELVFDDEDRLVYRESGEYVFQDND